MTAYERILEDVQTSLAELKKEATQEEIKRIEEGLKKAQGIMKMDIKPFSSEYTIIVEGNIKNILMRRGINGLIYALQNRCDKRISGDIYDEDEVLRRWSCLEAGLEI